MSQQDRSNEIWQGLDHTRYQIAGHAITSTDGKIADHAGEMPPSLRNEADWQQFQDFLDASVLVILGRTGHKKHQNPGRKRLVLTSGVVGTVADSEDPLATYWNPVTLPFVDALRMLGFAQGLLSVTGGTRVFDLFLGHYTQFVLAEVSGFVLPEGRSCFSTGLPAVVLSASGLQPGRKRMLDTKNGVSSTVWSR